LVFRLYCVMRDEGGGKFNKEADLDVAGDYDTASRKIKQSRYDLAILDIMGVNGLKLLTETLARGIPTMMLTAHAINPDTLMGSIRKGAISYLPKETLTDLDKLLDELLAAYEQGKPQWKLLFEKSGGLFQRPFRTGLEEKGQRILVGVQPHLPSRQGHSGTAQA
jgi:DNA-binding response OmpR family regulator